MYLLEIARLDARPANEPGAFRRNLLRRGKRRKTFLDIGDDTEIKPGMVFTVEPGLYASGLGGFRHSDTVAVTDDGIEFLTYYPRDLNSLTLGG